MASVEKYTIGSGQTRWMVRWRTPDGRQRKKRGFLRKGDASAYADSTRVDMRAGSYVDPQAGKTRLSEFHPPWSATRVDLSESWKARQDGIWLHHIEPRWGNWPVAGITRREVQRWISEMSETHAATSVRHAVSVLRGLLGVAISDGYISSDPTQGVRLPRVVRPDQVVLTPTQVNTLAEEIRPQWRSLYWFLVTSGVRFGEAAALRPRDLLGSGRVRLSRAYSRADNRAVLTDLKGHEARTVAIPRRVEGLLREQAEGKPFDGLLFPGRGGVPLSPPAGNGWLNSAVERCHAADPEFPPQMGVHQLRHTCASLLISSGASVKVVQRQLGHSSAGMTLDRYSWLMPDDLEQVAVSMEATLFGRAQSVPAPDHEGAREAS